MTEVRLHSMVTAMPERIVLDESVAITGAEGTVRFSKDDQYAVKIFHDSTADAKRQKLPLIMRLFGQLTPEQEQFLLPPLALVEELHRKKVFGFVMRRVPREYTELINVVLNPVVAAKHFKAGSHWGHLLYAARSVAEAVAVLHGKGCSHTDVHYKNFMVSLANAHAVMLEIDGVSVERFIKPGVFGFPGFIAPEILTSWKPLSASSDKGTYSRLPDVRTDRYSLAILILHILLLRNVMTPLIEHADEAEQSDRLGYGKCALFSEHETDRRHRPVGIGNPLYNRGALSYRMLTPKLQVLAESAFVTNLFKERCRPQAREWATALAFAIDGLLLCNRCGQCFLYQHWVAERSRRTCPFCGVQPQHHPSVIEFLEEGQQGRFRSVDRYATLSVGSFLHADQIQPNTIPPFRRKKENIVGRVIWHQATQQLHLVNEMEGRWQCQGKSYIKGQSLPLSAGAVIIFGAGYRVARIKQ